MNHLNPGIVAVTTPTSPASALRDRELQPAAPRPQVHDGVSPGVAAAVQQFPGHGPNLPSLPEQPAPPPAAAQPRHKKRAKNELQAELRYLDLPEEQRRRVPAKSSRDVPASSQGAPHNAVRSRAAEVFRTLRDVAGIDHVTVHDWHHLPADCERQTALVEGFMAGGRPAVVYSDSATNPPGTHCPLPRAAEKGSAAREAAGESLAAPTPGRTTVLLAGKPEPGHYHHRIVAARRALISVGTFKSRREADAASRLILQAYPRDGAVHVNVALESGAAAHLQIPLRASAAYLGDLQRALDQISNEYGDVATVLYPEQPSPGADAFDRQPGSNAAPSPTSAGSAASAEPVTSRHAQADHRGAVAVLVGASAVLAVMWHMRRAGHRGEVAGGAAGGRGGGDGAQGRPAARGRNRRRHEDDKSGRRSAPPGRPPGHNIQISSSLPASGAPPTRRQESRDA